MPMAVFRFGKTVDELWGSGAATDEVRIEHGVILPVNKLRTASSNLEVQMNVLGWMSHTFLCNMLVRRGRR